MWSYYAWQKLRELDDAQRRARPRALIGGEAADDRAVRTGDKTPVKRTPLRLLRRLARP